MNQEKAAEENGIALVSVKDYVNRECSLPLLEGEISGAEVIYHSVKADSRFTVKAEPDKLRTFLLIDGAVIFSMEDREDILEERGSYVAKNGCGVTVCCKEDSHILEILRVLSKAEQEAIKESGISFPVIQKYEECSQYREDFKSKKSISRSMIDHHILPGFCMGSNESYGPDKVEKHAHPLLDQFFFSFEENEVNLLIDDMIQPYEGNTLIHIPLGSDHGVEIPDGKKMHYVWIDFMVDPGAVAYLDEVHKKTGVMERFDENHQMVSEA